MWYKICPLCGSALDPAEKCDCQEEAPDEAQRKAELRQERLEKLRIVLERDAEQKAQQADTERRLRLKELRAELMRGIYTTAKTA